eukprot:9360629-Alexandrium_andersonii.AAC.1
MHQTNLHRYGFYVGSPMALADAALDQIKAHAAAGGGISNVPEHSVRPDAGWARLLGGRLRNQTADAIPEPH